MALFHEFTFKKIIWRPINFWDPWVHTNSSSLSITRHTNCWWVAQKIILTILQAVDANRLVHRTTGRPPRPAVVPPVRPNVSRTLHIDLAPAIALTPTLSRSDEVTGINLPVPCKEYTPTPIQSHIIWFATMHGFHLWVFPNFQIFPCNYIEHVAAIWEKLRYIQVIIKDVQY